MQNRNDEHRLEWYKCQECGSGYTWFNIEVIEAVELYGWVHQIQLWGRVGQCKRDIGMELQDGRIAPD